jgi:photosystem II stability/assembly factor-like uncharacterized protein
MTRPLSDVIKGLMQAPVQSVTFDAVAGRTVNPVFNCCESGTVVGVDKMPVIRAYVYPQQAYKGELVYLEQNAYSPTGTALDLFRYHWGDGGIDTDPYPFSTYNHSYSSTGRFTIEAGLDDDDGYVTWEYCSVDILENDEPNCLVLAAADGGVWRSTDGGQSWFEVLSKTDMFDVEIDPFTRHRGHQKVWACAHSAGLYRSDDSGANWIKVSAYPHKAVSVEFSPVVEGTIYVYGASTTNDVVISKSTDYGQTWTHTPHSVVGIESVSLTHLRDVVRTGGCLAVDYNDEYIYYYNRNAANHRIYRMGTDLAGVSSVLSLGTSTGLTVRTASDLKTYVGYEATDPGTGAEDGVWMSDDDGDSWTDITGSYIGKIYELIVDREDQRHLFIINHGATYDVGYSYDGGGEWFYNGAGENVWCAAPVPGYPAMLFLGGDDGATDFMNVSAWNGVHLNARDTGFPNSKVYSIDVC